MPFEVRTMRVRPDGFSLEFTRPVDEATATDLASYSMLAFTYHYRKAYGSPEIDHTRPPIRAAELSADGLHLRLRVEDMRIGHIHELHMPGLRTTDGESLLHDVAYYTLNTLPSR